ncbi:MAG: sorbitol-6-phosphate dehydrogenase [Armatimonadetes bacterium]|nr:sorbitol-6-phosphate dehydrogenase [Armatimonadota bacterium]MDE2206525.1 sorbitol-6-phosphate dehydrogenase [Armatimonadota bacterium]
MAVPVHASSTDLRLSGRVAVITGAGQGLGEALAHRLAQEGCHGVCAADRNGVAAARVAAEVAAKYPGCKTLGAQCDVTDEAEVAEMVRSTEAHLGPLDLAVSNAGILKAADVLELTAEDWRDVLDVNLTGYFLTAREAARAMAPRKRGVIIQINSKSGKKGSFRNCAYAASKFGGIGLTQSLALDLAPLGIRVNAVCPGNLLDGTLWQESLFDQYAKTQGISPEAVRRKYLDQVPLGRACTYTDVGNAVVFLASDEAAYMTGQAINVTGGQEMR